MQTDQNRKLREAIESARKEIARALREQWRTLDGQSAAPNLMRLDAQLREAAERLQSEQSADLAKFSGIVRWISDWIPNVDDPLVAAVAKLERTSKG
jgi:hypothetical protein